MPRKKTDEETAVAIIPPRMMHASIPSPVYIEPVTFDPVSGGQRPYVLKPAGLTFVHDEAQRGTTLGSIANGLGISSSAFADMRKRFPEVQEAFNTGRAAIVTRLSHVLVDKALAGNTVELLFALKTIGGFREGTPVEGAPQVNVNISIPRPLSTVEVERIIGRIEIDKASATDVEHE